MNYNKTIFIGTLLSVVFTTVKAQQTPVYSEYAHNSILLNPAHAGYDKGTDIALANRSFVSDIDGLPATSSLTVNSSTGNSHIGFGITALRDQIGVTSSTGLTASLSYKLIFDHHYKRAQWWDYNPNTLTFGISAGVVFYSEDLLSLGINTDIAFSENINETLPTVGVGALYNRNQFYVGVSNTNLLGSTVTARNLQLDSPTYAYGGYRLYTNRFEKVQIKPNFLLKYVKEAPYQLDLNVAVNIKNVVEFGAGYRTNSSMNILAILHQLNGFKMLFSYNFPTDSSNVVGSTLGLLMRYRIKPNGRR